MNDLKMLLEAVFCPEKEFAELQDAKVGVDDALEYYVIDLGHALLVYELDRFQDLLACVTTQFCNLLDDCPIDFDYVYRLIATDYGPIIPFILPQ